MNKDSLKQLVLGLTAFFISRKEYKLIKDHRTNMEIGNVESVMDGGIDPFINAYLKWQSLGQKTEE